MFWPSQPLVISVSGRMLVPTGPFQCDPANVERGSKLEGKRGRDVIEKERFLDREENREQEKWKEECSRREFGVKEASMVPR